jgi:hypothetical protein
VPRDTETREAKLAGYRFRVCVLTQKSRVSPRTSLGPLIGVVRNNFSVKR